MSPVKVTDGSFEQEVLKSNVPVLVDFWAEWCGPCKMVAPLMDQLADEYSDRLKVVKVNVDENQEAPARYGVRGIPTLLLFRDGEILASKVGALSKTHLQQFVDQHVR